MPPITCDKCGELAQCLTKEQLTKVPAQQALAMPQQPAIGWRYYLSCPKCGTVIQEKLHNAYLDGSADT